MLCSYSFTKIILGKNKKRAKDIIKDVKERRANIEGRQEERYRNQTLFFYTLLTVIVI